MLEELGVLARGIAIGIAIAAPLGPIGLLCIRRTAERGILLGLATGFGSAVADGFFGAVAAFGVTAIIDALLGHVRELRLFGGLFLLSAAAHGLLKGTGSAVPVEPGEARGFGAAIGSGVVLTFTNPITILGIIAVVVGFGGELNNARATALSTGVFLGSLAWWSILCGGVSLIRHRFTARTVHWINRITAVVLAAVGLWALGSAFGLVTARI